MRQPDDDEHAGVAIAATTTSRSMRSPSMRTVEPSSIGIRIEHLRCPRCGGPVDLVDVSGCGVTRPSVTASGEIAYCFEQQPFWACCSCAWAEQLAES